MEQLSSANTFTVTTTTTTIANRCLGKVRRTQLIITNLSAGTLTINKNDTQAAVANQGIILAQNQTFIEADDAGYSCWQGAVQAVGSTTLSVSVVESFTVPYTQ